MTVHDHTKNLIYTYVFGSIAVPKTDYFSYAYALTILAGGCMGYAKSGSAPSLGAGLLFGGAAAYGAYQLSQNKKDFQLALLTSGALLAVMGFRFYKTGKFMPAGLIAGLSLLQCGRLAYTRLAK